MIQKTLTPQQLERISEVDSPILRQRYALYVQLPEDLQETMFAEKTTNTIWVILKDKYNLTKESLNVLSKVIGLIMLGEIPIKNFIIELAKELGIDNNQASSLAQDINQQIFQPVRESLMEVHGLTLSSKYPLRSAQDKQVVSSKESLGSTQNKQVVNNKNLPQPKPISIEELEKINKPQTSSNQHTISSELEDETNKRRERLLEKLKQDRKEERIVNLSSKTLAKKKNTEQFPPKNSQAITTAWNGRTIDLTKIPPRRKSARKKDTKIKIYEA